MAKTAIKKSFSLEDEGGENPESEGNKKTLEGMFESMMPLSGKKNKKGRDDSDSEDAPKRTRGRGAQNPKTTTKKEDPDAEIKKEVSKVIKGSGPVLRTLHHTMYAFFHVKNLCNQKWSFLAQVEDSCDQGS